MTTTESAPQARLRSAMLNTRGLFYSEEPTPCNARTPRRSPSHPDATEDDLWFDSRRTIRASRQCADCPFRGRCGFNAVMVRATHGVWGGVVLPGDYPAQLEPIYARLLAQFEQRRDIELGSAGANTAVLPTASVRLRRQSASVAA